MSKPRRNLMITTLLTSVACGGMGTGGDGLGSGVNISSNISRNENGCRQYWHEDCAPGDSCNPPPPAEVQCPPELLKVGDEVLFLNDHSCQLEIGSTKTVIPCPIIVEIPYTPPAPKPTYLITRIGDHCEGTYPSTCPRDAPCNPPAPDRLKCPEVLTKDGAMLTMMDNVTCSIHYPTEDCAPGEPCPHEVITLCPDLDALKQ